MRVRSIDVNNDWTFGKGRSNYKTDLNAVSQNIKTRLQSFLGDCFAALDEGIDWFNLLGAKNQAALQIALSTKILNTEGVTGLVELSINLDDNRQISIQYTVDTIYGTTPQQNLSEGFLNG